MIWFSRISDFQTINLRFYSIFTDSILRIQSKVFIYNNIAKELIIKPKQTVLSENID